MRTTATSRYPTRRARRITFWLGARDHTGHGSLLVQLLQRARRSNLSGASVFEARMGYGASRRVHQTHLLSGDAPLAVVIIDHPDRIDAFLLDIADLLQDVLVTIDDIDVIEL